MFWPIFDPATRTASIPFSNTVTFTHSNPAAFYGLFPYDTINPSHYFTPDPGIITFSPPNATPHNITDLGVFSLFPVDTDETGTISFSHATTTGFFLHLIQPLSQIDFDQSFTLISSDGDLGVGNSNGLTNNVLFPLGGPGDSDDDGNATIFFAAGIRQVNYRLTVPYYGDGFSFAFTFPDTCTGFSNIAIIQNDTAICSGSGLLISLNQLSYPGLSILWSTGDTASVINVSPIQSTSYYVTLTQGSLVSTDSIRITVKPSYAKFLDMSICNGQNYEGYTVSGTYIDTLFAANGCDSIRKLQLTVLSSPIPRLGADTALCGGDTLKLDPGPFTSYSWQDGSVQNQFTVKQPGIYSVVVTNNCGSARVAIIVKEKVCDVYFPSGFTPNGDGRNDRFKILGGNELEDFHIIIFNRWGQKVFETSDYRKGWDGSFEGRLQQAGVFVWYCRYKKPGNSNKIEMHGTVALIR